MTNTENKKIEDIDEKFENQAVELNEEKDLEQVNGGCRWGNIKRTPLGSILRKIKS